MKKVGYIVLGILFLVLALLFFLNLNNLTGNATETCLRCPPSNKSLTINELKAQYQNTTREVVLPSGGLVLEQGSDLTLNLSRTIDLEAITFYGKSAGNNNCKLYFLWKNDNILSSTFSVLLNSTMTSISQKVRLISNHAFQNAISIWAEESCPSGVLVTNISLSGRPLYFVSIFSTNESQSGVSSLNLDLPEPMAIKGIKLTAYGSSTRCILRAKYVYEDGRSSFFNSQTPLKLSNSPKVFNLESGFDSNYKSVKSIELYSASRLGLLFGGNSCSNDLKITGIGIWGLTKDGENPISESEEI
jgi:hypothetical protein